MTARSLPARPSLDSLRKQARTLARDRSLTLRNGQLAVAREYGFAGWRDLVAEVHRRAGGGFDAALGAARRAIHDSDVERLKGLLAEYPALSSVTEDGGLLGMATSAYGDAGDAQREQWFTRKACAELLIDAGAVVTTDVCEGLIDSRARGLLELFERKGILPRTPKFRAALGDSESVRAALDGHSIDAQTIVEAFVAASRFGHSDVASLLLDRSIALDPELGRRMAAHSDRTSFVSSFATAALDEVRQLGLWAVFVMSQVRQGLQSGDLPAFAGVLQREPWLLAADHVAFQAELIEKASFMRDRGPFIAALLDMAPAILRHHPPPSSRAIDWAIVYANTHLLPMLTRIWPVPDDLSHAAGIGDMARVRQWFDAGGRVRELERQYPYDDVEARSHLHWAPPSEQQVLDAAFAFAVINRHFGVADFLLARGADIDTNWNSHEPASILHHLVFLPDPYEPMRYLIDRGIDMTIKDYRWNSTAIGWARYGNSDEALAQWLEEAERRRGPTRG